MQDGKRVSPSVPYGYLRSPEDKQKLIIDKEPAAVVRRYTDFTELTTPMLNEFIEKIVVQEATGGRTDRKQKVDVYFNFVGQRLSPYRREIILLYFFLGFKNKEIAALYGCIAGKISYHKMRAVRQIQAEMEVRRHD